MLELNSSTIHHHFFLFFNHLLNENDENQNNNLKITEKKKEKIPFENITYNLSLQTNNASSVSSLSFFSLFIKTKHSVGVAFLSFLYF
jgi:hypothetical protein